MRLFQKLVSGFYYYIIGNIFAIFLYKREYISGKYFSGRLGGIFSLGWKWIVVDGVSRLLIGVNKGIPFPISPMNTVINPQNIFFNHNDLNNFQGSGKYFQAINGGKIFIGKGCWIANNVGLITANHDINNLSTHMKAKDIRLGDNCWVGMNSVILPGVELGENTIVGAGSIVTKSFTEGNCIIAGNPANIIKKID